MFSINCKTQSGKIMKKALAYGRTEESAWKAFNDAETWRNYREAVIFVCVHCPQIK